MYLYLVFVGTPLTIDLTREHNQPRSVKFASPTPAGTIESTPPVRDDAEDESSQDDGDINTVERQIALESLHQGHDVDDHRGAGATRERGRRTTKEV